jgi:virulence factor Mce-like protein
VSRRAITAALLVGLIAIVLILVSSSGHSSYLAAAEFDTAEGMVPGQLVKIAGARVGTVTAVKLEPGPHALIEFSVEPKFGPFHADARCQILPEGLISENYVQCDPGSPSKPSLQVWQRDRLPTVPLTHTTVPVSLQNVLNIFSLPVDQRLSVLINELGIGTAGQGADINAILRRANPALTQTDKVLAILGSQDQQLGRAVSDMRSVLGSLAKHDDDVRSFVDHGATVGATTAQHQAALQASVKRLPPLLSQLQTNLVPLNRVATDGRPLLGDLQAAAPAALTLTRTLPAFAKAGTPALNALARAAAKGSVAVSATEPVSVQLTKLASVAPAILTLTDQLLVSSRDSGSFEGLLRLLYSLSTDSGAYDSLSHFVTALIVPFPTCLADPTTTGCSHAYDAPAQGSIPINNPAATRRVKPAALKSLLNYLLR